MLKQVMQITLPYSPRQHLHRAMDVQINNSMIILWHRKARDRVTERLGDIEVERQSNRDNERQVSIEADRHREI